MFHLFLITYNLFILSLGLETSLIDDPNPDLEWERQNIVDTMCDDERPDNWEEILADTSDEFKNEMLQYAKDNLIKMHLFISSPFATEYKRYIETTRISFVANVGGNRFNFFEIFLLHFHHTSIVRYLSLHISHSIKILLISSIFRFNGFVHGIQFRQFHGNHLLFWQTYI